MHGAVVGSGLRQTGHLRGSGAALYYSHQLCAAGGKIYFHTGFRGRKLDNLEQNPQICLEISEAGKIYAAPHARDFTMRFWSVLVFGRAAEVEDENLKLTVMNLLLEKYAPGYRYEPLSLADMGSVNVIEITMDEVSGKVSVDP